MITDLHFPSCTINNQSPININQSPINHPTWTTITHYYWPRVHRLRDQATILHHHQQRFPGRTEALLLQLQPKRCCWLGISKKGGNSDRSWIPHKKTCMMMIVIWWLIMGDWWLFDGWWWFIVNNVYWWLIVVWSDWWWQNDSKWWLMMDNRNCSVAAKDGSLTIHD